VALYERVECDDYHATLHIFTVGRISLEFVQNHPDQCVSSCGGRCWL